MNKLQQIRKKGVTTLIAISIIGIAVYLGFTPLFEKVQGGVAGAVLGASFGAIFVIVLTMYLLNKQTEIEQETKKSERVFDEKVGLYKEILTTTENMVEDGEITAAEVTKLPFALMKLQMLGGDEAIDSYEKVFSKINEVFEKHDADQVIIDEDEKLEIYKEMMRFTVQCRVDLGVSDRVVNDELFERTQRTIEKSSALVKVEGGDTKTEYRTDADFWKLVKENGYDAKIIDVAKHINERLKSEFADKKFHINYPYKVGARPRISLRVDIPGNKRPAGFGDLNLSRKTLSLNCKKSPRWDYKQMKVDNLFLAHWRKFSFDEEKKEFSRQRAPNKDAGGYAKYMPGIGGELSSITEKELDGYIVALKESAKTVEEKKILPYTALIKEAKSGNQKSIERLKQIISDDYLHELTADEIASEAN